MIRHLVGVATAIGLTVPIVAAQAPTPIASPQVNPDRTITLRFRAPNARLVEVIGELEGKPAYPMTKGADGIWSITIGPFAPDVYNYQFRVDATNGQGGVIAMDPANPWVKLGFGGFPPANLVEVPGDAPSFDAAKNVPHGTVRLETYHSKTIGGPRTAWVYTPPGYDRGTARYPVFYLLHGSGNIDSSWILTGRANYILDNLIAEGRAKPMILVMPYGYATSGVGTGPLVAPNVPPSLQPNRLITEDVTSDLLPWVEKTFRTLPGADNRAVGGLSMGGGQAIGIGFSRADLFHSIVVMSAGARNADQAYPGFFTDAAATNKQIKLLWVGIGKDDTLVGPQSQALQDTLKAKGITHTYRVTDGRHEWVVWRHHLREVAPLLFSR